MRNKEENTDIYKCNGKTFNSIQEVMTYCGRYDYRITNTRNDNGVHYVDITSAIDRHFQAMSEGYSW